MFWMSANHAINAMIYLCIKFWPIQCSYNATATKIFRQFLKLFIFILKYDRRFMWEAFQVCFGLKSIQFYSYCTNNGRTHKYVDHKSSQRTIKWIVIETDQQPSQLVLNGWSPFMLYLMLLFIFVSLYCISILVDLIYQLFYSLSF